MHRTGMMASPIGRNCLLLGSTENQLSCLASPLESNWGRNTPTRTPKSMESSLVTANCFKPACLRSSFPQPALLGVGNRSAGRSSKVEVKATQQEKGGEKVDYKVYQALMRGGEEVIEMMKEMATLLEDIAGFSKDEEIAAVRLAAAGAVGKKLGQLDGSFLMALDWMLQQAQKEKDDKKVKLLELIKETILAQISKESPPQVQVLSALCTTSCKDARQEILRRCAGGGGTFKTETGGDLVLPAANLNLIANQADDIIGEMEEKPLGSDRRLLAKLILARDEARSLLGGGILDERNDNKGFKNLPEPEVDFLSKLIALKPSPPLRARLENVMRGKEDGEEKAAAMEETAKLHRRPQRLVNLEKNSNAKEEEIVRVVRPVRPGIFLETLTKLIGGMYESNTAVGVAVQQLEWIRRVTLEILQEMAFS